MTDMYVLSERQSDLRVNRTIHWLRKGVPAEAIDPSWIDVTPETMPELIKIARKQMAEDDEAYAKSTRKGALLYMGFGAVMLCLSFVLASGDVPLLRQGRLLLGFALGGASFVWGIFRFFNHNPDFEF